MAEPERTYRPRSSSNAMLDSRAPSIDPLRQALLSVTPKILPKERISAVRTADLLEWAPNSFHWLRMLVVWNREYET